MKTLLLIAGLVMASAVRAPAATNDLTTALQRGLFEEEANLNLDSAIQAYQSVASQFDKDRKLAATAIFRLGECYRKQGNTNDAAAQYQRILREFTDQTPLVTLSRQNLAALGTAPTGTAAPARSSAARQEQKRLLEEEIKLVERKLEEQKKQVAVGRLAPGDLWNTEQQILQLKRQVVELEATQPSPARAEAASTEETAAEAQAAQAEAAALKAQIDGLMALDPKAKRIAVQQDFPNPVLTDLMQKLASAEQKLASLQKEFGPEHMDVVKAEALVKTINQQIDAQVEGVLNSLAAKRNVTQARLAVLSQAEPARINEQALGSDSVPSTVSEAEEVKRIQALIRDSPDLINARDGQTGATPLHRAAQAGQLVVARFLLANGADTEAKDQQWGGRTPLHYAAMAGHKAMIELLLSKKASVRAVDGSGNTPLHLAAMSGYRSVVEVLLAHGAEVDAKDQSGATPLHLASAYGFKAVAELLLDRGADLNAAAGYVRAGPRNLRGTPLCIAAERGDFPLTEMLLAKGAKVDADDGNGRTPLSYAVQYGYGQVVKALLAAHADPNAGRMDVPLAAAAFFGDAPSLQMLLANGADPNTNSRADWDVQTRSARYSQGSQFTPLFLAVVRHHPEAVKLLTQFKANPNSLGPDGTPILFEALTDNPTFRALLEGGADPNVCDKEGSPPLLRAIWNGDQAAVELLLAHHADPNLPGKGGWTPLHAAASSENKADLARLLLKSGADVNARDQNGATPLYAAAERGNREMVALLLENKADPNARTKWGRTPLEAAKSRPQPLPGAVPWQPQGVQATQPGAIPWQPQGVQAAQAPAVAIPELLRQHGAQEDLPRMDRIEIRRPSANYSQTVFYKGTNDYNHFTLLELIAVHYGFVSASTGAKPVKGMFDPSHTLSASLGFPSLENLVIRRATADGRSRTTVPINAYVFKPADCSTDVKLQWGDVIELPEADHPISAKWQGLPEDALNKLNLCLRRTVELTVKGQSTNLVLTPLTSWKDENVISLSNDGRAQRLIPQFCLLPVLNNSGLLRASSDLSRVKVTRLDSASGQTYQLILDCSQSDSPPDLWLRDGDKIEVPEKP